MTDKQIIGGRGSAKPYTTLNTIEVMLENEKLKSELKRKEQECEHWKHQAELGVDTTNRLIKELKETEEECERLKLDLIEAKAHGDYLNNLALSETLNLVSEQLDQLKADLEQMTALKDTYFACYHAKHGDLADKYDQLKAENEELTKWLPIVVRLEEQFGSHEKTKGLCYKTYAEQVFREIDDLNGTIDNLIALQLDLYETLSEIKKRNRLCK